MDFLILIKNGCDNLTATVAPSVDSLGLHMVLSLATIMMAWFGVQEALASAQGGPGFNMAKFLNFFVLLTFAYCFVKFYDGSIPGIGYSLKSFISGGTSSLVDYIGNDSTQEVQIHDPQRVGQSGDHVTVFDRALYASVHVHRADHSEHFDCFDRRDHCLWGHRGNYYRLARPRIHSMDGIRQNRFSVLGMA